MTAETSFVPVPPEKGRTAAAAARAEAAQDEALRAQPRARAHARGETIVTALVAPLRPAPADRRVEQAGERGRPDFWTAQPASLATLAEEAAAGPDLREGAEWHWALILLWRAHAYLELAVTAVLYGTAWVIRRPKRLLAAVVLAAVVALLVVLGTAGGG